MSTPNDDLQRLYEDASAMDDAQPAPSVRTAVLAHAAMLAQGRNETTTNAPMPRSAANWPHWKSGLVASILLVPLLGMLMFHLQETPEWQETVPAPGRTDVAAPYGPAVGAVHASTPELVPGPVAVAPAAPIPSAPAAPPPSAIRSEAVANGNALRKEQQAPPATTALVADAAPAPSPAAENPAPQGALGAAANTEQRADRPMANADRASESTPLVSNFAAPPAPAKAMARTRSAPTQNADLMRAAERGDLTAVLALLNAGASLQARDTQGRTVLMWAAMGGHTTLVQRLLELGADRTSIDQQGWSALQYARHGGHRESAALLE